MAAAAKGKAVIFDMDGVLVDTAAFHREAWYDLAAEHGLKMSEEFFERTFGMQNSEILPLMADGQLSDQQTEELSLWKEHRYRTLIAGEAPILDGVRELIDELTEQGFALAVGSSAPKANIDLLLTSTALKDKFASLASADDTVKSKPAPDTFLVAAGKLGVPAERCVVVEDSVAGVQAGKTAQMAVVAVTNTRPAEMLGQADLVVDSLTELTAADFDRLLSGRGAR